MVFKVISNLQSQQNTESGQLFIWVIQELSDTSDVIQKLTEID